MSAPLPSLGRLSSVPPREVWKHEALSFTPWLRDNVDVLNEVLGMDLELDAAEHPVGSFSLDLIGRDAATGTTVIVENQLEQSDHSHLGQLITYAAGTEPTTILWIATDFRPEHRAALDWLNERTDEETRFFGVVIRVVQIGDSDYAPAFDLVAQPNDWEKRVKRETRPASARESVYREFWEAVLERIRQSHPHWTNARTTGGNWCGTSSGVPKVLISMIWFGSRLTLQLYFESPDPETNRERFNALRNRADEFEAAFGAQLEWDPMEGRKAARIIASSDFNDIQDRDAWPAMTDWLIDAQGRLRRAIEAVGEIS